MPTVKLGILTDGMIYQLFSDTEEENLMDNEPFAVVDLAQVAQKQIADDSFDALLKLRRGIFDPRPTLGLTRGARYTSPSTSVCSSECSKILTKHSLEP